jgi:hypothetical protein
MAETLGIMLAVHSSFRSFECALKILNRRKRHLSQWFTINLSTTGGTLKFVTLKPRNPVRVALATCETLAREVNLGSSAFGIRKNLSGRVDVIHKRAMWPALIILTPFIISTTINVQAE